MAFQTEISFCWHGWKLLVWISETESRFFGVARFPEKLSYCDHETAKLNGPSAASVITGLKKEIREFESRSRDLVAALELEAALED